MDQRKNKKIHYILEMIILIITICGLVYHLVYRSYYENQGYFVIHENGVVALIRSEKEARSYREQGDSVFRYQPHITNSIEVFSETLKPVFRITFADFDINYNPTVDNDMLYEHVTTQQKGSFSFDFTQNNHTDVITLYYRWITNDNGNHYVVVISTSQDDNVRLIIDVMFRYLNYILVLILIVHSMRIKYKCIINEYRRTFS